MNTLRTILILLTATLAHFAHAQSIFPHRTIALTGQPAPGTETGTIFHQLAPPSLNYAGDVVFQARLAGPRVTSDNEGLWATGGGALQLVALANDIAPGTTQRYRHFDDRPMISDFGHIAFRATLNDFRQGIWGGTSAAVHLAAHAGLPAPGTEPGVTFEYLDLPLLNGRGEIAFAASLAGPTINANNAAGVWAGPPSALALQLRAGEPAPQLPAEITLKGFQVSGFTHIPRLLLATELDGPGVDNLNDNAVHFGFSNNLRLVAREGAQAHDTAAGTTYRTISKTIVTEKGHVAYLASFAGPDIDASNGVGAYLGPPAPHASSRAEVGPHPGFAEGVTYHNFSDLAFDRASGNFAFAASVNVPGSPPGDHAALWSGLPDDFRRIAYTGMPAPGAEDATFHSFGPIFINFGGQIAFIGYLTGPSVDVGRNHQGIWATDRRGNLRMVARTGIPFEIAPGQTDIITWLTIASSDVYDLHPPPFNDLGQLAFHAQFPGLNNHGIFIASTIPEPVLFLIAIPFALFPRRRTTNN